MIDIENKIFTEVYNAVRAKFPDATVQGEGVFTASQFPLVTFVQESNTTYVKSLDNDNTEHHASVMFECNIYCNDKKRKTTCKSIADLIDNTMLGLRFTRSYFGQTPNLDQTIYRMTLRYTAVVGEGIKSGNTTTYQLYRN